MKYLKYLITILLILSFTLISCKKDSTGSSVNAGVSAIAGNWTLVDFLIGETLTTNSNQTATNPFLSDGSISVSGMVNTTLDYLEVYNTTNPISFDIINNVWTMNQELFYDLYIDQVSGGDATFYVIDDSYNVISYTGNLTYTFNGSTLIINQTTLTDSNTNNTVTISGTISIINITVPNNTPTFIQWTPSGYFDEEGTMTINTDGTYSFHENQALTEAGTFIIEDDRILFITIVEGIPDTIEINYFVNGYNMTLIMSEDACADSEGGEQVCLAETEESYQIAQGSLVKAELTVEQYFTKAAAKPLYSNKKLSKESHFDYFKIITNKKEKLKKFKLSK